MSEVAIRTGGEPVEQAAPEAGAGTEKARLAASLRRWNRTHVTTALVGAVWLLLMAVTGVLVQHQEELGLLDITVPNRFLPAHYTDEFRPESNPLGVVITDLHSGRFLGERGKLAGDLVALILIVAVLSGIRAHRLRRQLK